MGLVSSDDGWRLPAWQWAKGGAERGLGGGRAGPARGVDKGGRTRSDSNPLAPTPDSIPIRRPEPSAEQPQALCLGGGYACPGVGGLAAGRGYSAHIRR